jgi:(4S)-4-hydroxy-5-phosphonooxypentane-2,3-dione isomerase
MEGQAGTYFAITVAFELVEGAKPVFAKLIAENAARSLADEPGCLRFDVLEPKPPNTSPAVFLYEIYTDEAAFAAHLASTHYKVFDAATKAMVTRKDVQRFSLPAPKGEGK